MPKLPADKRLTTALASQPEKRKEPLWKGPEESGITYSLLSRFICDRERFRLLVVEGLKADEGFNHKLEYGNMWHVCEESLARTGTKSQMWQPALLEYAINLGRKYPEQSKEVEKWYRVCRIQFPLYVDYWAKHPDVVERKPLLQEEVFDVLYKLPSGRVVKLLGKMDSVDLLDDNLIWLQEDKSKGDPNAEQIRRELSFDLQTMTYLTALDVSTKTNTNPSYLKIWNKKLGGVRYNVIRRPLSGRKYNIIQLKGRGKAKVGAETEDAFYNRLRDEVIAKNAADFFFRIKMPVSSSQLRDFQRWCLNPILEQLWDWWEWIKEDPFDPWTPRRRILEDFNETVHNNLHFIYPYGVWNPALEGRPGHYDDYLATGSENGLTRVDNLFPELS